MEETVIKHKSDLEKFQEKKSELETTFYSFSNRKLKRKYRKAYAFYLAICAEIKKLSAEESK